MPVVSVVFLAYNRREQLLESIRQMLGGGYPADRLELIVVDNASSDGTAEGIEREFAEVKVIRNAENVGASGWNRGFARAAGDYVLILDDDAYLRPGDLARAVRAAEGDRADLVSFTVVSSFDEGHRLNDDWQTGLLSYWGCAALVSRRAIVALGGYDPNIFIWANEAEFTMRLLDRGFRHLLAPEISAVHMKEAIVEFEPRRYRVNARHHAYIAAKLMRGSDALAVLANIVQNALVDTIAEQRSAIVGVPEAFAGFATGLRHRQAVRPAVSSAYRHNFRPFAGPWRFMRSPSERIAARRGADGQRQARHERYFAERDRFYPDGRASLEL